jgi:hypothetical protein
MDDPGPYRVEEIDSPLQRTIRRRRAFFAAPIAATILASIALSWEIVRQNLPANMLEHWPWRLRLLDLQSGATVVTVLGLLLFTRAQYAEIVRPVIGWSLRHELIDNHTQPLKGAGTALILVIYNSGGGVAVVESATYRFARNEDEIPSPWISADQIHGYLASAGLQNQKDYFLNLMRAGYPLPPNTDRDIAPLTGAITLASIVKFRIFDIKVTVRDSVGDTHERVMPCRAVVLDADIAAEAAYRRQERSLRRSKLPAAQRPDLVRRSVTRGRRRAI